MKLALSYFYQIRNFKHYMIPVSTAVWDPQWFHIDKTTKIFKDNRSYLFCQLIDGDSKGARYE